MSSYAWGTWEGTAEGFLAEKWKQPRQTGITVCRGCREALWDRRRAVRPSPEVGLFLFVGFVGALILVTGGIDGDALVFVPLRVDAKLIVFSRQDGVQGNAGDSGDS